MDNQVVRTDAGVLGELLFFSFLMFTLPFVAYFVAKHYDPDGIFLPVVAAVVTVWIIIAIYVYRAYGDQYNYYTVQAVEVAAEEKKTQ